VLNGVAALDIECDGLASKSLYEDLHASIVLTRVCIQGAKCLTEVIQSY
jgi:hypothetical protein